MSLKLENLLPGYFEKERTTGSEVWGKHLNFSPGEYINIVAPSGSGKTSLIHFLYGLRSNYLGSIQYNDKSLTGFNGEDYAHLRKETVSVVLQDLRLFPAQTVNENLELKRQLTSFHPEAKIAEMATRLGVHSRLDRQAQICSYGEQQRVAIIRALLQPFQYLLLDEPFSHLDRNNSQLAMDLILEECRARNACIIFADLEHINIFPATQVLHL